jgi:plastocyanin
MQRSFIAILLLSAAPALVSPPRALARETNGRIEAVVHFSGTAPPAPDIVKPPDCGTKPIHDESYVVGGDKALANAVVSLVGVKATVPAPRAVTIDQHNCQFSPHVLAVTLGTKVTVTNGDATLHTAHGTREGETLFNVATPAGMTSNSPQILSRPGVVHLGCDVGHTWMSAFIHVFDHGYFGVSGGDGKVTIADVPPGDYTLQVWHEKLGQHAQKVTVGPGQTTSVTIDLKQGGAAFTVAKAQP